MDKYFQIYQNYIQSYIKLLYKTYNLNYTPVPTIYYNYSLEGSIIDENELQSGTYDLFSKNSGVRWNRIFMFPLFTTEPGSMMDNAGEKGIVNTNEISAMIPNEYNLNATEYDFVYFIDDIEDMMNNNNPLFRVINVNYTSLNKEMNMEHINLKTYNFKRNDIDQYIHKNYIYLQGFNNIFEYGRGKEITEMMDTMKDIIKLFDNKYNNNFQSFVFDEEELL
jgi:hypothetical protein